MEREGIPAVPVATDEFISAARIQASAIGRPDLDAVYVAHPIQDQTPEQIAARADAAGLLLELSPLVKAPDVACKIRPAAEDVTSLTFPASSASRFRPARRQRDRILVR